MLRSFLNWLFGPSPETFDEQFHNLAKGDPRLRARPFGEPALVSDGAASRLHPSGFDPARGDARNVLTDAEIDVLFEALGDIPSVPREGVRPGIFEAGINTHRGRLIADD
jgi:hypothetical protein